MHVYMRFISFLAVSEVIFTARKRSLRRLCFYRCLSFILFTGGACVAGGACVVLFGRGGVRGFIRGGMRGFIGGGMRGFIRGGVRGFIRGACMVLFGGRAWFYLGGCAWFYSGGRAWFYSGGMRGFIQQGGVRGFIQWGGMRGFFSFSGYNEIRSMSGRYASYWNAFLFIHGETFWHCARHTFLPVLCCLLFFARWSVFFSIGSSDLSVALHQVPHETLLHI